MQRRKSQGPKTKRRGGGRRKGPKGLQDYLAPPKTLIPAGPLKSRGPSWPTPPSAQPYGVPGPHFGGHSPGGLPHPRSQPATFDCSLFPCQRWLS